LEGTSVGHLVQISAKASINLFSKCWWSGLLLPFVCYSGYLAQPRASHQLLLSAYECVWKSRQRSFVAESCR